MAAELSGRRAESAQKETQASIDACVCKNDSFVQIISENRTDKDKNQATGAPIMI